MLLDIEAFSSGFASDKIGTVTVPQEFAGLVQEGHSRIYVLDGCFVSLVGHLLFLIFYFRSAVTRVTKTSTLTFHRPQTNIFK